MVFTSDKIKRAVISFLYLLVSFIIYWIVLVPLNVKSYSFWMFFSTALFGFGLLQYHLIKRSPYWQGLGSFFIILSTLSLLITTGLTIYNTESSLSEVIRHTPSPAIHPDREYVVPNWSVQDVRHSLRKQYPLDSMSRPKLTYDKEIHPFYITIMYESVLSFDDVHIPRDILVTDAQSGITKAYPYFNYPSWIDIADITGRVDELYEIPADERYILAQKDVGSVNDELVHPFKNLSKSELRATQEMMDIELLNNEFGNLINQFREEHGLKLLSYQQQYTNDMVEYSSWRADTGYIASPGQGSSSGKTFLNEEVYGMEKRLFDRSIVDESGGKVYNSYRRGIVAKYQYTQRNPYRLVSEKYLAEVFFNEYLSDEFNKELLLSENINSYAFVTHPTTNGSSMRAEQDTNRSWHRTGDLDTNYHYTNYRPATSEDGIGFVGSLIVMREGS